KGSHLVVAPFPGAPTSGVYAEAARDGRPFFVLPWNGLYLIGTTDVRYAADPAEAAIDGDELDYLASETERLFPGCGGIAPRVLYTQAGVRALPYTPDAAPGAITRRHAIHAHRGARGVYSIVGGKLTTYRSLAEQVVRRLRRDGFAPAGGRAEREHREDLERLPGAIAGRERDALEAELAGVFGARHAARLVRTYGRIAEGLLRDAAARPELAAPAASGSAVLRVELVHALESEWATSLIDLLQRRVMVGLDADFGLGAADAASRALVELGVWEAVRAADELAAYRRHAKAHRAAAVRPMHGDLRVGA